jgi:HSP20 family protein
MKNFFGSDWMDDFFNTGFLTNYQSGGIRTDVKQTEKEYIVEAELPGYKKEDINVELNDNRLTIAVSKNSEKNEETDEYIRRERQYGQLSRSFMVDNVDQENIQANYQDGILTLTLPKIEEIVPKTKQISIN